MIEDANPPHLVILGEADAILWVLENQTVAFPEQRHKNLFPTFGEGDTLYLYSTRGAYHNRGRDRGRVFARVTVTAPMERSDAPYEFGGRKLPIEVPIEVEALAPARTGVNVADLVPRMTSFPKPETWSVYLRRSAYPLTPHDAELIDRHLAAMAGSVEENLDSYRQRTPPKDADAGHIQ